jgi:hypothetical protein
LLAADGPSATEQRRYDDLGGKIMCTCGCTQMLLKCNHVGCPNSDRMERELRALVSNTPLGPSGPTEGIQASTQGARTDDEVLDWFRKNWGITAVVEPAKHGFALIAWIVPPAFLGLGLFLVILLVRSWRLRSAPIAPTDLNLDPDLEAFRIRAHRETEL